jgi:type I restriction enzyme S subunit
MREAKSKDMPSLRFPEFTMGWEQHKLGQRTSWQSGGTPSKNNKNYWNGSIPWISAASMHSDYAAKSKLNITEDGLKNGSKLATKDSILLLVRGSMLFKRIPVCIATRDVAFNQDVKSVVPDSHLTNKFLFYLLKSKEHRLLSMVSGTGIGAGKFETSELKAFIIAIPDIKEQRKITEFLGAVDTKLTTLRRKRDLLAEYKRGVMQKLFSQEIRFVGDGERPFAAWEVKRLGEIGEFKNGLNAGKDAFGSGIQFINLMDVFGKSQIKNTPLERVEISKKELENYRIQKGDVLFVRSSVKRTGVGQSCLIDDEFIDTVYSGFIIRFRQKGSELIHDFLKYCFSTNQFRKQVLSLATSSANTNINQESLVRIQLAYPSKVKQQKIADFLTAIDDKITAVTQQIEHMETFKKGLLQQMFV